MTALNTNAARKAEKAYITPRRTQLAALCWRRNADGGREILLVTSSQGRWILPKGWPMDGKSQGRAAAIEAWEEAGVAKGKVARKPIGHFVGAKVTREGDEMPCITRVYPIKVTQLADEWPERGRRERRWVAQQEAVEIVSEDGLRDILQNF